MDFATPWTAVCQGSLSFTISWSLLKLKSIELMMPSNHLILYHPLLLLPSISHSIRVFSNELVVRIRWPKYWSFRMGPSNDYSGFVSFRIDWSPCCPKDSQESSPALQLGSINSLQSAFFMVHLALLCVTTGKTIAWTIWTFVSQEWCLCFLTCYLGLS